MKRPFLPPEDRSPQIEGCYNFFFPLLRIMIPSHSGSSYRHFELPTTGDG